MNAFIANAQIGVDDNTKFTLGYLKQIVMKIHCIIIIKSMELD